MNLTNVSKEKQQNLEMNDERVNGVREERVGSHRLKASLRLEEQWSDGAGRGLDVRWKLLGENCLFGCGSIVMGR